MLLTKLGVTTAVLLVGFTVLGGGLLTRHSAGGGSALGHDETVQVIADAKDKQVVESPTFIDLGTVECKLPFRPVPSRLVRFIDVGTVEGKEKVPSPTFIDVGTVECKLPFRPVPSRPVRFIDVGTVEGKEKVPQDCETNTLAQGNLWRHMRDAAKHRRPA